MTQEAEASWTQVEAEPIMEDEEISTIEQEQPPISSKCKFQTFTLADLSPTKWRDKFQEFKPWVLLEAQKLRMQTREVLL